MEYLDIVDENGVPTGKIAERTAAHKQGLRHRTSHVWILRERAGKVEVLLQKRSQNKDSFPGCYDISSAGHIPAGVDFIPSALRELKEELGCSVSENELIYCGQRRFSYDGVFHGKEFHDRQVSNVYALWLDRRPEDFVLQKEELEEVRWFEFESCLRLVEKNEIPHCIYLEELQMLLPEVRKRERLCILVTPPVTEEEKQQLLQAAPGQKFFFTEKPEVTEEQLRRAEEYVKSMGISPRHPVFHSEQSDELYSIVRDMMDHNTVGVANELRRNGLLHIFLSVVAQSMPEERREETDRANQYVRRAVEFIQRNYCNPIRVTDVADYVCVNRSYLYTLFQKSLGMSPQQFLAAYRLTKAAEMLMVPHLPVESIALSCGYQDPLVFSKAFRQMKGVSPTMYRKQIQQDENRVNREHLKQVEEFISRVGRLELGGEP